MARRIDHRPRVALGIEEAVHAPRVGGLAGDRVELSELTEVRGVGARPASYSGRLTVRCEPPCFQARSIPPVPCSMASIRVPRPGFSTKLHANDQRVTASEDVVDEDRKASKEVTQDGIRGLHRQGSTDVGAHTTDIADPYASAR